MIVEPLPDNPPPVPESWPPVAGAAPRRWAAPEEGTSVLEPPAATGPVGPARAVEDRAWQAAPVVTGPPRLPVPLQPMTLSDILDGSWAVMKARPRTVLGVTAVIILPVQLLSVFLQRGVTQTGDFLTALSNAGSTASDAAVGSQIDAIFYAYIGLGLGVLSYYFLGAALGRLVSTWYAGGDLTVGQVLAGTFRRAHVIVAAFLLLLVPTAVLSACYLGAFFVIPLFILTAPIITIEHLGPFAAAKRSWILVSRRLFPCILVWFVSYLVETLVNQAIEISPDVLALFAGPQVVRFVVPIAASFARFVTAPFVVGVAVLLYLDLRVRTEGLDLELEATEAFARAA